MGQISYQDETGSTRSRYFTVAAGVGADALFLSRLNPGLKRRLGYALYLIEAFRLWVTYSFPLFEAAFVEGLSLIHIFARRYVRRRSALLRANPPEMCIRDRVRTEGSQKVDRIFRDSV